MLTYTNQDGVGVLCRKPISDECSHTGNKLHTYGSMGTKSIPTTWSTCLSIENIKVEAVEVLIKRSKYLRP